MSDGFEATNRGASTLSKAVNKVTFKYSITVKLLAQYVRLSRLLPCYTVRQCVRVRVHLSPEESRKRDYSDRSSPLLLLQEQSVL